MSTRSWRGRSAAGLGVLCLALVASPASAAEFPPIFDPGLSLTGSCGESTMDPVKDPGCPYPPPPAGPSGGFEEPRSIAIDAYGNEYVASYAGNGKKGRIDIFDDEGIFITEIADPQGPQSLAVDSKGNLYAFEAGEGSPASIARYSPSVYMPETGEIKYENPRVVIASGGAGVQGLALDLSNDHLFIAKSAFILEYSSAVEGNTLLNTITHPKLNSSAWVAVDSQRRRLYASYCKEGISKCGVLVFNADAPYELLEEIDGSTVPVGKFISQKGWLSIAVNEENGHFFVDDLEASQKVYEFDENFDYFATLENEGFQGGNALQIALSNAPLKPTARNRHYLFVPVLFPTGRALAFMPPVITDPEIKSLEVTNVGETEAEFKATIDPNGGDTEYMIEVEGPGLEGPQVVAQGTILGTSLPKQVNGLIDDLEPGATYDVRAFAENEADHDESKVLFATYSDAEPHTLTCPNQALRTGPSAFLPDCRAYELVTPADTNGRPAAVGASGDRFGSLQSSLSGDIVSFDVTGGALPEIGGSGGFHGDPYRATRGASGWSTVLVGPTGAESAEPQTGSASPDQSYSFFVAAKAGTLPEGHYIRYPDGHSELVGSGSLGTDPAARGRLITEGGTHIVFETFSFPGFPAIQLESDAPPTGINAVYDRTSDGVTHVVSLLPGSITPTKDSLYRGTSADGTGIAFENEGTLYLRLNNTTTFQIGSKGAVFAGISDEGQRVFYVEGGDLKAFDTGTEDVIEFTETGDAVPVNVAPEGTRAYFVSEEAIASSGPNPNGDEPQVGEQNLYRSDEGAIAFVGTVSERDVEGVLNASGTRFDGLGLWTEAMAKRAPGLSASRLTPDGGVFIFQSRADLDGYDSGEFAQIYRYDSVANSLDCLSCPPTKVPATGGAALQSFSILDLAAPLTITSFVPNLRADGARAFFESTEALVSSDTDEVRDVYEWEEEGVGSCTREGGCIYLISSGHSARNNYLFGHSASGDDVFFTTGDVLIGGDEDTVSVYDARVNGGFAATSQPACEHEECRPPLAAPPALALPAPAGGGNGNVSPKRCPRGKKKALRHGRIVCVKKKPKKHRRKH